MAQSGPSIQKGYDVDRYFTPGASEANIQGFEIERAIESAETHHRDYPRWFLLLAIIIIIGIAFGILILVNHAW